MVKGAPEEIMARRPRSKRPTAASPRSTPPRAPASRNSTTARPRKGSAASPWLARVRVGCRPMRRRRARSRLRRLLSLRRSAEAERGGGDQAAGSGRHPRQDHLRRCAGLGAASGQDAGRAGARHADRRRDGSPRRRGARGQGARAPTCSRASRPTRRPASSALCRPPGTPSASSATASTTRRRCTPPTSGSRWRTQPTSRAPPPT